MGGGHVARPAQFDSNRAAHGLVARNDQETSRDHWRGRRGIMGDASGIEVAAGPQQPAIDRSMSGDVVRTPGYHGLLTLLPDYERSRVNIVHFLGRLEIARHFPIEMTAGLVERGQP